MTRIDHLVVDLDRPPHVSLRASDETFTGAVLAEDALGEGERVFVLGRLDDVRHAAGLSGARFEVRGEGPLDEPRYTVRALDDGAPRSVDALDAGPRAAVLEALTDVVESVYALLEMPARDET